MSEELESYLQYFDDFLTRSKIKPEYIILIDGTNFLHDFSVYITEKITTPKIANLADILVNVKAFFNNYFANCNYLIDFVFKDVRNYNLYQTLEKNLNLDNFILSYARYPKKEEVSEEEFQKGVNLRTQADIHHYTKEIDDALIFRRLYAYGISFLPERIYLVSCDGYGDSGLIDGSIKTFIYKGQEYDRSDFTFVEQVIYKQNTDVFVHHMTEENVPSFDIFEEINRISNLALKKYNADLLHIPPNKRLKQICTSKAHELPTDVCLSWKGLMAEIANKLGYPSLFSLISAIVSRSIFDCEGIDCFRQRLDLIIKEILEENYKELYFRGKNVGIIPLNFPSKREDLSLHLKRLKDSTE